MSMFPQFGLLGLGATELLLLLFVPVAIACFAFWIWMLIDCANNETDTGNKIAWILIILFASLIGAVLYFFIRKAPRNRTNG